MLASTREPLYCEPQASTPGRLYRLRAASATYPHAIAATARDFLQFILTTTLGRAAPSYTRGWGAYCCFARREGCLRAAPVAREKMKPPEGIEPPLRELEPRVIPLDQSGLCVKFVRRWRERLHARHPVERVHAPARVRRRDRSIDIVDGDGGAERRDGGAAQPRAVRGWGRHGVARVPAVVKMSARRSGDAAAALFHEVGLDLRARRRVARHFFHVAWRLGAACARGGLVWSEMVARGENVIVAVPRAALLHLLTLLARAHRPNWAALVGHFFCRHRKRQRPCGAVGGVGLRAAVGGRC